MKMPHLPRVFTWTPLMLVECAVARWVYVDMAFACLISLQLFAFIGLCWVDLSINYHRAKLDAMGDTKNMPYVA